jgi:hypothetical protein
MQQGEEQISMVMLEASAHHLLFMAEDEEVENNDSRDAFLH